MRRLMMLSIVVCLGFVLGVMPARGAGSFTFTTIDFPGAITFTNVLGINSPGEIVGFYGDVTGKDHGFLLAGGSFSTIDFPDALQTGASGINNRGEIVGFYRDTTGVAHGFLLARGSFSPIDFPGAVATDAFGINDPGEIVGTYRDTNDMLHGFLLARGSFSTIDFPGALHTSAGGINNPGEIAGGYRDATGEVHGFLLAGGSFSTIDFPDALHTGAVGINNRGEIVGGSAGATGIACAKFEGVLPELELIDQRLLRDGHGFLLAKGSFSTINFPGACATLASRINNRGEIVGIYIDATFRPHGFLATPIH